MMQTNLLMTSVIVVAASSMAFGQTKDEPQSTPAPAEVMGEPVKTVDPGTVPETAPIDPASIAGLIEMQAEGQQLASDLLGSDVADRTGEAVGQVTDLILNKGDRLVGAVVSTGGFLGIGRHEVGIELTQLQRDAEWNLYVLDWSQDQIEAAPAFLTLADQEAEREAELLRQQQLEQLEQPQAPAGTDQLQQ